MGESEKEKRNERLGKKAAMETGVNDIPFCFLNPTYHFLSLLQSAGNCKDPSKATCACLLVTPRATLHSFC